MCRFIKLVKEIINNTKIPHFFGRSLRRIVGGGKTAIRLASKAHARGVTHWRYNVSDSRALRRSCAV